MTTYRDRHLAGHYTPKDAKPEPDDKPKRKNPSGNGRRKCRVWSENPPSPAT